jgi:flagellin
LRDFGTSVAIVAMRVYESGERAMVDFPLASPTQRNLSSLVQAKQLIDASSRRITTGLRVSSPLEGVAAFFDAKELTTRSAQLLNSKEKLADAAEVTGGTIADIDEITSLLTTAKLLAAAAKGGAVSGATATTATGDTVTTEAADVTDTLVLAGKTTADDDSFTITHDGTTTTITNTAGSTFTSLVAQIDGIADLSATVSDGNAIVITASDGEDIIISNATNTLASDLGLSSSTNGIVATNASRSSAETQLDLTLSKISKLVGESSYSGTNLLKTEPDTLTVALNENGGNVFDLTGVASTVSALSLTEVDAANLYATDTGIDSSIAEIDAAIATLARTRATISTGDSIINSRLEFANEFIDLLGEGADRLIATNLDEEQANLLALQTRHDLSATGIGLFFQNGTILTSILHSG